MTAWHMGQRIRKNFMEDEKLSGIVEVDEAFIGGKEKNKHAKDKGKKAKLPVIGLKERESGRVIAVAVAAADKTSAFEVIRKHVKPGSTIHTDEGVCYKGIEKLGYKHETVNHSRGEYVKGDITTNGIEGFWARLKKGIRDTHIHVSKQHLQRYLDDYAFRETKMSFIEGVSQRINA